MEEGGIQVGGQEEGRVGEVEGGMVEGGEGQIQVGVQGEGWLGEVEGGMVGRGEGEIEVGVQEEGQVGEEMREEGGVQVWGEVEGDE